MCDIDAEPGHPPVEPETINVVEGTTYRRVPPVEVRLLRQKVVQVILAGARVERPRRSAEGAQPIVRGTSVGLGVGPDVPIAVLRAAGGPRVDEPRMPVAPVIGHGIAPHL